MQINYYFKIFHISISICISKILLEKNHILGMKKQKG